LIQVFEWRRRQADYFPTKEDFIYFISICSHAQMPQEAQKLFDQMTSSGFEPTVATYSSLLQGFAEVGDFVKVNDILVEMRKDGLEPNAITYTGLLYAYGKQGHYSEMANVFNNMKTYAASQSDCAPTSVTYSALLQCFAKGGLFARMEKALKEMTAKGLHPDGLAVNSMILGYAEAGLVKDMERAYSLVRPYKVKVRPETIRAVALAYIRKSYFYQLGTFARYHTRRRVSLDKLIENLLLLSHAANFSMRRLAEEYVRLKETGFEGNITSFNIRALAFSKMQVSFCFESQKKNVISKAELVIPFVNCTSYDPIFTPLHWNTIFFVVLHF
jgi:pentatricopeptide repeat protein